MSETSLSEEAMEIYRVIFSLSPHMSAFNNNLPHLLAQKEGMYLEINMLREKLDKLEKLVQQYTPKMYGI